MIEALSMIYNVQSVIRRSKLVLYSNSSSQRDTYIQTCTATLWTDYKEGRICNLIPLIPFQGCRSVLVQSETERTETHNKPANKPQIR